MYVLRCTAVRSSSESLSLSLSLSSPSRPSSFRPLLARKFIRFFFFITSLVLMILKWRTTAFAHSLDSLSLFRNPFHSFTRSFSLSLSNTGRVLSDKNSSLNKHTIQKFLSYRLTASVKRVFIFYNYFFLLSLPPFFFLSISLSTWRS